MEHEKAAVVTPGKWQELRAAKNRKSKLGVKRPQSVGSIASILQAITWARRLAAQLPRIVRSECSRPTRRPNRLLPIRTNRGWRIMQNHFPKRKLRPAGSPQRNPVSLSEFYSFNLGSAARPALESALVVICSEVFNACEPHRRAAQRAARMCNFECKVGLSLLHLSPRWATQNVAQPLPFSALSTS